MRGSKGFLGAPSRTPRRRSNTEGESRVSGGVKQAGQGGRKRAARGSERSTDLISLEAVERAVVACERCTRLRRYCEGIAREKKRAFRDQEYWGRPVPGFGD